MKLTYCWWHYLLLALILLTGIGLRFYQLDKIKDYYFDEVYHVPTAKMIAKYDQRAYEWHHSELRDEIQSGTFIDWLHPPLAKLFQAASILFFGDNSFAWRAASALFGSLLLILIYVLTRIICSEYHWAALLATGLAAIDGLSIAQSRIAMNDIFVTFFMTAGVLIYYLYLQENHAGRWLVPLALTCGLAISSKWSGIYLLVFIAIWEVGVEGIKRHRSVGKILGLGCFLASVSLLVYLLSYFQLFTTHPSKHFLKLHQQIFAYQLHLNATHPYQSKAWEWPLGLKPVYLYLDPQTNDQLFNRPFYPSWLVGLLGIIGSTILLGSYAWQWCQLKIPKNTKCRPSWNPQKIRNLSFLLLAYYCFWIFWCFSPRIMFFYHYLPASALIWVIAAVIATIIKDILPQRLKIKQKDTHA